MTPIMLTGFSKEEIERKIDAFLAEEKPFKVLDLIMPADGRAARFEYRGFHVRTWVAGVHVRYDAAVELEDEE